MPRHGSEIGIAAVGASFVLSCWTAVEWIQRVEDGAGKGGVEALKAVGKGLVMSGSSEEIVQPVVHTVTWWRSGALVFTAGTQIDGLVVMMLFVVTLI